MCSIFALWTDIVFLFVNSGIFGYGEDALTSLGDSDVGHLKVVGFSLLAYDSYGMNHTV